MFKIGELNEKPELVQAIKSNDLLMEVIQKVKSTITVDVQVHRYIGVASDKKSPISYISLVVSDEDLDSVDSIVESLAPRYSEEGMSAEYGFSLFASDRAGIESLSGWMSVTKEVLCG